MSEPSPVRTPTLSPLIEQLQSVTEQLAATNNQTAVLQIVLEPAMEALRAIAGAVLLVDSTGELLEMAATRGHEGEAQTIWQNGPIENSMPAGAALARHQSLYFEHPGALVRAFPELEERIGAIAPVATAVLPLFLDRQPLGVIVLDFREPHEFTPEERRFLQTLAAQCGVALGRTQTLAQLRQQVTENEALNAFTRFTEVSTNTTDIRVLIQHAAEVFQATLGDVSVAHYELEDGLWRVKAWSNDITPTFLARMQRGFTPDTPRFAEAVRTRQPVFLPIWDSTLEGLPTDPHYVGLAAYLYPQAEQPTSLISVGFKQALHWTDREEGIVRAVGRSLGLALHRAEQTQQLQEERAGLDAFVAFTERATWITDVLLLARRAVDVLQATLGEVSVAYYQLDEDLWKAQALSEEFAPEVVAVLTAGIPISAPSYAEAVQTREAVFVSGWTADREGVAETESFGAGAFYPCFVDDTPKGLLAMGTQQSRAWTTREQSVFQAIGRSLTLALERSELTQRLTEQRDALELRSQELQVANEELEAFTYSASHDLRTPVRHVMGFAEMTERAIQREQYDKAGKYLETVKQGALRMNSLIDGMLILSRSGRQELRVQPVDLNDLTSQACRDVGNEFAGHPVRWQISDLPKVQGDAGMLQQVMTNLLSNAVKYSSKREVSEVRIWSEDGPSEWTVRVQDNGVGFDPAYAQKLFGIFQRLHSQTVFKGTGVGLATVRRIILKHGGQVSAEGHEGRGATFSFTLPKER